MTHFVSALSTFMWYKSFTDRVLELGHINKAINVFKIDCEGCEMDTFRAWIDAPVKLQQILVEIHKHGATALMICFKRCTVPVMPYSTRNQIYSINSGIFVLNTALCCCRPN